MSWLLPHTLLLPAVWALTLTQGPQKKKAMWNQPGAQQCGLPGVSRGCPQPSEDQIPSRGLWSNPHPLLAGCTLGWTGQVAVRGWGSRRNPRWGRPAGSRNMVAPEVLICNFILQIYHPLFLLISHTSLFTINLTVLCIYSSRFYWWFSICMSFLLPNTNFSQNTDIHKRTIWALTQSSRPSLDITYGPPLTQI